MRSSHALRYTGRQHSPPRLRRRAAGRWLPMHNRQLHFCADKCDSSCSILILTSCHSFWLLLQVTDIVCVQSDGKPLVWGDILCTNSTKAKWAEWETKFLKVGDTNALIIAPAARLTLRLASPKPNFVQMFQEQPDMGISFRPAIYQAKVHNTSLMRR